MLCFLRNPDQVVVAVVSRFLIENAGHCLPIKLFKDITSEIYYSPQLFTSYIIFAKVRIWNMNKY